MKKIKFFIIASIILISSQISGNELLYSFTDIHIENESNNSLEAKKIGIDNVINEKFRDLIFNITIDNSKYEYVISKTDSQDFLKNIVINNEIVTNKKYIADLEIYFDKEKIIKFYKKNNILFSDTESPNFLILSSYNFGGTDILWEKNNWNNLWKNTTLKKNQLNISIPNEDNKNKILISSIDINKLNKLNIKKILNYYNIKNSVIINANNIYNPDDGKIYTNLLITHYKIQNDVLENIYDKKILLDSNKDIENLIYLTDLSNDIMLNWWKGKTITHFDIVNNIECKLIVSDIFELNEVKNNLLSISQVDDIYLKSINSKDVTINIKFYGNIDDIKNIFNLSKLNINYDSNVCLLNYEPV
tara:strand:- start:2820 stop:3902 length:1083 start_codon:yes stop_codon:yes gene_type:complete